MSNDFFVDRARVDEAFRGRSVALVGSGPGSLQNRLGLVDSHDVVVRVNNYRLFPETGWRTDVFYSYFGGAIKKTVVELQRDGVKLCICKCPDAQFMESDWHRRNRKLNGVDFRLIYENRRDWWFCPTFVPSVEEFMQHFNLLGGHVPTTGFAALLDVLSCSPRHVFMTGYDFFSSRIHNVNERWRKMNKSDPIGHVPGAERQWFIDNYQRLPITMDRMLTSAVVG